MPIPAPETITDARGRRLLVQELSVLQQTRLLRAIGPLQSTNQPYVGAVVTAAMVREIDGVPTRPITSERDIDAAIERLDDDGIMAVNLYRERKVAETMKVLEATAEAAMEAGQPAPSPLAPSSPSSTSNPSESVSTSSATA